MGKNIATIKKNVNTVEESNVQFLIAESFKKANVKPVDIPDFNEETSSISSSDSSHSDAKEKSVSEDDGMEYLAGFMARKFKKLGLDLGKYSYLMEETENPSYVQRLSKGGLTVPNSDWLKLCYKIKKYFNSYHKKKQFKSTDNVKRRVSFLISKKLPDLNIKVIQGFVAGLIKIRCKELNKKIKALPKTNSSSSKRQLKLNNLNAKTKANKW